MASTAPAKITAPKTPAPMASDAGANHAYYILHWALVILPIVTGIDKFYNVLTSWQNYLAPAVLRPSGMAANEFMSVVGMVEILAGVVVAFWPRVGAYILALWEVALIANLAMANPEYWYLATVNVILFLCALSLGSLSGWHNHKKAAT